MKSVGVFQHVEQALVVFLGKQHFEILPAFASPQASEGAEVLKHVQQVLDDVLAVHQVDALQALVCQVARIAGLPKGHQ